MKEGNNKPGHTSFSRFDEKQALSLKPSALSLTWSSAWKMSSFRWKFWIGMLIFIGILIALPFFFNTIEERNGLFIADIFLKWIPPRNVSVAVFFLIWSCCLILIIRIYRDPMMLLVMLWAYNGVTLVRMACIGLISLNPPAGLIPLMDPITNQFYGQRYITHDLFFSGHTTTVFLIFLCLKNKYDRIYALSASILLGFLLLVQHVHYTIDVLGAPLFTYAVYRLTLIFTKRENQTTFPEHGKG
ncbi:MAG TPA: phosphatase PAP2-related protein [Puia sp.]|nr:phosphatase PAP2-related protein [Puia sp.]